MSEPLGAGLWLHEYNTPWDCHSFGIKRLLAQRKTAFQEMLVVESGQYGKALILDGKWQVSKADEFLYHEPLVHMACCCAGAPERVLILGGADGGAAREALKWRSVKEVALVDIDGDVVAACREFLPEIHKGSLDDPRTTVHVQDALDFVAASSPKWDVIVSDLTDPIEEGPAFALFTREFMDSCRRILTPGGVLVMQAGCTAPSEMRLHVRLASTMRAVFGHAHCFGSYVPSWSSPMGFILGKNASTPQEKEDAAKGLQLTPDKLDALLAANVAGELRCFDGEAAAGMLQLPKYLRDALAAETTVYTAAAPPGYYLESGLYQE